MTANQNNKLSAYRAVDAVLEDHETTWQTLPAFAEAVTEFRDVIPEIHGLAQVQANGIGAVEEKQAAFEDMVSAAEEIAAATHAYAVKADEFELAVRVDYSRSDIIDGRQTEVVTRCRDIHAAATEFLASLADYGVTAAKLTKLKSKIDTFDSLQPKPRQRIAKRKAATKSLPQRFDTADLILGNRLDKLVLQFKGSAPEFVTEYRTARTIVDSPGSRKVNGNVETNGTPTPVPQPVS